MPEAEKGLIQIYTGEGKGKTTAALGLALRASGQGKRVEFIQFLKNELCGEHFFTQRYQPFKIVQMTTEDCFKASPEKLKEESQKTLAFAQEEMLSGKYDLLILDEIFIALSRKFISLDQVENLIDKKPRELELVLTGRYAPPEIIQKADLVTEMRLIKHPMSTGIMARRGIEY
jgi:cob(I)alamin adenosyltransferase